MKTFSTLALVLMAAASASASQELHIQLRVHTHEHQKLYITPMGKQCAYDAKIDAAEYPCRDGGVCVRKNSTYGVCELPKASTSRESHVQMRAHGKHHKLYITPMGKQCAYDVKIDAAEYPCRDGGVCVRKNSTYGVCELPKASAHKSHTGKHQKLYITPMGKQCAYDEKVDAAMYPCRDGGVCVRKNETYGVCELPGQASSLDSDSGSDDSDSDSDNLELPGSQDESDSSDVSDDESGDSQSSADDDESEDEDESVDEDDSVDNTIA